MSGARVAGATLWGASPITFSIWGASPLVLLIWGASPPGPPELYGQDEGATS